ncbi:T9SS type A sorting domain-containing protein [Hymenobacter gummosus]|uniref:T9SS type A sorting domain-containing protein n=1 Tax=Hymenobacter gummosus TaxID=1776032 RepID=A0A3S0JF02_9BACT|nr:zinc-dependent metalloprotease family protein [Hymenobacter gummosus]RTQ50659.1 T9SS type A sorting domain-containing protein [Hymenobacter gummosus]
MRTHSTPTGAALRGALLGGLLAAGLTTPFAASAQRVLWADAKTEQLPDAARRTTRALDRYRVVSIQTANLRAALASAPLMSAAGAGARTSATVVSLPLPDGTSGRFRVMETQIMHPRLAAQFPMIKTYAAQGIDDPAATAYFDVSPAGLHVMILSPSNTVFMDPSADGVNHLVFYKRDINRASLVKGVCGVESPNGAGQRLAPTASTNLAHRPNGGTLRTYRLAMACTGEYAATKGGTVTGAMSGITTSVTRVSGVYTSEMAVAFQLVPNNASLVYLNGSTDPYTNNVGSTMLGENQTNVDNIIGAANYDIGHVFSTGGGGIARLRSVCVAGNKASGVTGLPNPVGDAFDIDFVAHEIGHQFGGNHTFNGNSAANSNCTTTTRSSTSAFEPGSGSTIMAYAGICGTDDLQENSDPYFHTRSYDEILTHITGTGNCATNTATNNTPPTAEAGARYVIPQGTPFELTGSGTDANGDVLTYCWEQYNLGPGGAPSAATSNAPIFRSFSPTTNPTRTFPRLSDLLNNTTTIGEMLPTYSRQMIFRLTVRDNRAGGGGVEYDTTSVPVVGTAGPFVVTAPNTNVTWRGTVPQQVTWDVANTTAAPINAANVDILLSIDGGLTFPYTLLANTPNDGSEAVTVPGTVPSSTRARIKVKASGNIFFDLSNTNFNLVVPTAPGFFLASPCATTAPAICPGATTTCTVNVTPLLGFTGAVTLTATGLPTGMTAAFSANPVNTGGSTNLTLTTDPNTTSGTYTINIQGNGGNVSESQAITVTVRNSANVPPTLTAPAANTLRALPRPTFTWSAIQAASSYDLQVSVDPTFPAGNLIINQTGLTNNSYTATTDLTQNQRYYWRVRGIADCGTGNWSANGVFFVGQQLCIPVLFNAVDVPQNIPSTASASASSVITVAAGTNPNTQLLPGDVISAIRVRNVRITHPNTGELILSLNSPNNRRITLATVPCGGTANLNASFSDTARLASTDCPINRNRFHRPVNSLETYRNATPFGNWTLEVRDIIIGNGGDLTGWSLEFCTTRDALPKREAQQLQGVSVFPNPSTGEFQLNVDNGVRGTLSVQVTDAVGRVVLTKELNKGAGMLQDRLDLSKLSRGMYQLHLSLPGGGTSVEKLMKL